MQEDGESASSPRENAKNLGHKLHSGEHNGSSVKMEDEETPLSKKILSGLNDLDCAAGKYAT
ncbi:MAG TPA: hypothetical protein VJ837_04515, partial [Candidatus Paceibacterota bacterium]|nr:hypothetical protein [Candidatus Paceibacterota bacterium]